jgi:hypothetical protein
MPRKRPKSSRGRGRPYVGTALYGRAWLADWFEETAEKYRRAGSHKPYIEAFIEFLEFEYADKPEEAAAIISDEKRFERERRQLKKKRLKGKPELRWLKEGAERMNSPEPVPVEEEPVEEARPFRKRPPKYPK